MLVLFVPSFIYKKEFFINNNSVLINEIEFLILTKCNVDDFLDNDLDALIARIIYVHDEYISNIDPG